MSPVTPDQAYDLAVRYAPVLKFGKNERFFPMNTAPYVSQSSLHRFQGDNEHVLVVPPGYLSLDNLDSFEGHDFFIVNADSDGFIDPSEAARLAEFFDRQREAFGLLGFNLRNYIQETYDRLVSIGAVAVRRVASIASGGKLPYAVYRHALELYGGLAANAPAYYYRWVPGERYGALQYWYFYAYNDWATSHKGVNDHEGDWESIMVFFEGDDPAFVVCSGHHGFEKRAWGDTERINDSDGDHPVAYIMPGSHAAFGTSEAHLLSGELTWPPGDVIAGEPGGLQWAEALPLQGVDWVEKFNGRWGARYLWIDPPGADHDKEKPGGSPAGPKYSTSGSPRTKWTDPVGWAGLG